MAQPMTEACFDPRVWLDAFIRAGGTYAITSSERLWLGAIDKVQPLSPHTAPLIGHPERVDAIKALVRERCLIA
jgi:hypothetical protein